MSIVVQKYGGSSVATAERIKAVARRIAASHDAGDRVVAVVSAMGDTTDELNALARQVSAEPSARELALLHSTGETIAAALMTMALHGIGREAVAFTGFQAGIRTNPVHTRAQILDIDPKRLLRALERGAIPVVAGYQGWTEEMDISVLGRGGSDTTAVALAIAVGAADCEIYTDVDGVYTADPRVVPEARKLDYISYEEMLEMAYQGARVMKPAAVELGEVYSMPIVVRSSFTEAPGTVICREAAMPMEARQRVRSIAHDRDVGRITIVGVPDRPGIAYAIFHALEEAPINVDVIVQNVGHDNVTDLSFTVSRDDLERALRLVRPIAAQLGAREVNASSDLAKISIVGSGLVSSPGYAAKMFGTLAQEDINIVSITTSEIRITCLIDEQGVERAARALHQAFLPADDH